jgi:hypothetical protein
LSRAAALDATMGESKMRWKCKELGSAKSRWKVPDWRWKRGEGAVRIRFTVNFWYCPSHTHPLTRYTHHPIFS